ncbi:TenA family transcriptional regulator [Streptomyces caeruleatus]|uniref:Uncharacterized protein n=1 Tax=Streptomyces caeruleatus TaxID=661399 RepID=A0A117RS19_9ACTN|nr:iron-containing redox enzyme family protein [Streptomyces caeruleatus]KUO06139.1 hypothetical protein AQJ67_04930 [Streptomyces caeruleatus]
MTETAVTPEAAVSDTAFFEELDRVVAEGWARIHTGPFYRHVREHGADRELYRRTMCQLWHYIQHNPLNQAVAVLGMPPGRTHLIRYAVDHSLEELGHEKMIEHDLRLAGLLDEPLSASVPLPATQAFIGWLYYVSLRQGAVARMGYSYWAESSYDQIGELLDHLRGDLGLTDRSMSFFVAHSTIDAKHSDEVRKALERNADTPEVRRQVIEVARTSLYLNAALLDNVLDEYLASRSAA